MVSQSPAYFTGSPFEVLYPAFSHFSIFPAMIWEFMSGASVNRETLISIPEFRRLRAPINPSRVAPFLFHSTSPT